jgi:hypothetical protein
MVSIVKKSKYKDIDISLTYTSDPAIVPHHPPHPPHPGHEEMTMMAADEQKMMRDIEKIPSFFFPPKMVIKFKDEEININEKFHAIKTFEGNYFTHYLPYRFFESPWDLSQAIVDSLIVEDEIRQLKMKEGDSIE